MCHHIAPRDPAGILCAGQGLCTLCVFRDSLLTVLWAWSYLRARRNGDIAAKLTWHWWNTSALLVRSLKFSFSSLLSAGRPLTAPPKIFPECISGDPLLQIMMSAMLGQCGRQNELYYCSLLLTIASGRGAKAGFTMDRGWNVWLPPPPAVKTLVSVSCWVVLPAWQGHLPRELMRRQHSEIFFGETCSLSLCSETLVLAAQERW